jgi:hypothetical protein|tara:strand:+ start:63 stop:290 length:228 start_codon:yes stop_codon:yes gene_type:complete
MQKFFNVIAVTSGVLSLTVVGAGLTVYLNKDKIVNEIQEKALEAVTGSLDNVLGDSLPIPESTGGVIPELPKSMF